MRICTGFAPSVKIDSILCLHLVSDGLVVVIALLHADEERRRLGQRADRRCINPMGRNGLPEIECAVISHDESLAMQLVGTGLDLDTAIAQLVKWILIDTNRRWGSCPPVKPSIGACRGQGHFRFHVRIVRQGIQGSSFRAPPRDRVCARFHADGGCFITHHDVLFHLDPSPSRRCRICPAQPCCD